MEEIILKQLTGESLSFEEQARLTQWLQDDVRNRTTYNQIKLTFLSHTDLSNDTRKNRVRQRIEHRYRTESRRTSRSFLSGTQWLRVAVVGPLVASALGIAMYVTYRLPATSPPPVTRWVEKVSLEGQKITTTLPDGTVVKLNGGSQLTTPKQFATDVREVTLQGEAFFEVAENPAKPFVVRVGGLRVRVVGTSFNINTYSHRGQTSVAVATGKVQVSAAENTFSAVELVPGKMLTHRPTTGEVAVQDFDWDEELAWKDNILVFKRDNITTISATLERWYGVTIEVEKEIPDDKYFTGKYDNPTLVAVLEGLSFVYAFEYTIHQKTVLLQ